MKKSLVLFLTLALSGCASLPFAPAATQTPVVIVETVLVTVAPPQEPTQAPTDAVAPTPSPQVIVVTATGSEPAPTTAPGTAVPTVLALEATAPFPPNPGGTVFTNLTRSEDKFYLRCKPDVIRFGVTRTDITVAGVDFYYRIQDRLSTDMSGWVFGGSLEGDNQGNFWIDFPASRVDEDLRSHRAWFDYQFVGTSKSGGAVGRSAKLAKQVTYAIDCSD